MEPLLVPSPNYIIGSGLGVDNYYAILVDVPQVFPFSIQQSASTTIQIAQTKRGMQDGSLIAWLSATPLGAPLFWQYDWMQQIVLRNQPRIITLCDRNMSPIPPGAFALEAALWYYLNVKNNEAKQNSFQLIFSSQLG
jgi:hypothetical protein